MTNKSKKTIVVLTVFLTFSAIAFGGWYLYQSRECLKKVSYIPERDQKSTSTTGVARFLDSDKGNYYQFNFRSFKTHGEAMRACVWK